MLKTIELSQCSMEKHIVLVLDTLYLMSDYLTKAVKVSLRNNSLNIKIRAT